MINIFIKILIRKYLPVSVPDLIPSAASYINFIKFGDITDNQNKRRLLKNKFMFSLRYFIYLNNVNLNLLIFT